MAIKRIGIVCSSVSFGGLELNTLKLAVWLRDCGWEVHLLLHESGVIWQQIKEEGGQADTIQQHNAGRHKLTAAALQKWVQAYSLPLLLAVYNKDIPAMSWYKRTRNRHIRLAYQQHMKVGVMKRDLIHTLRYAMLDQWISPLQYLKKETQTLTRVPEEKIVVIPLAVETKYFTEPDLDRIQARKLLNLPEEAWIIGVLGRLDPKKGQDFLVSTLATLRTLYPDIHLLIMGNATLHEGDAFTRKVHGLVAAHELTDRVHFREHSHNPVAFYRAIDVFAIPSHGETFGMVTVEAMAAGVPVLGTGRDGTKEILQDGALGWLHAYEDEAGFVRMMQAIRAGGDSVETKIKSARETAIKTYAVSAMIKAMDRILSGLL